MSESLTAADRELLEVIARAQIAENAAAARKAAAILEFDRARVLSLSSSGPVEPEQVARDIVCHVAMACRVSPSEGRKRLNLARDLHLGLAHVAELFAAGEVSEYKVQKIVAATAHLDPAERASVDARLSEHSIERLGVRRVHDLTRAIATEIAPDTALARARAARSARRVTLRPSVDGMADLILHLPAEQAVAAHAALRKAATEERLMADIAVERLTGQATAGDVNVEVQLLMPLESLLDPSSPLPAEIAGHGPIPTEIARQLLATTAGRKGLRRLITSEGIVIGGDSRRRRFDGFLESLIRARDGHRCAAPYCDAPIRHIDHIERWADGGTTTFWNGRGFCAFHNLARESGRIGSCGTGRSAPAAGSTCRQAVRRPTAASTRPRSA